MAAPITWRNVDVNPVGEISRALSSSQIGLNAGFDNLANVLKSVETTDAANWNQQKTNNTNEFLNTLSQYRTPEEYQAAVAAGTLQNMLASRGAQIDQQVARTAMDAQLGKLQDRVVSGQKYQQGQTEFTQAPLRDKAFAQIALGNVNDGIKIATENNLTNFAPIAEAASKQRRALTLQDREDAEYKHKKALTDITRPLEIQNAKDSVLLDGLNQSLAKAQQEHRQLMNKRYLEVGAVAKDAGLMTDSAGNPMISDMTTEDLTKLDEALVKRGLPKHSEYLTGDTKARDAYLLQLENSGVPAHLIKKLDLSGFDSGSLGLVGRDARKRDQVNAENAVGYEKVNEDNWFSPGHPNARKAYDQLRDEVPKLIDKSSGWDPEEDVADMQKFVYDMATKGVEVSPGRFVVPPVQLVKNAIATAKGGWFTDAQRRGSAESILAESIKNFPDLEKSLKQSAEAEKYFNKQAVKKKLLN